MTNDNDPEDAEGESPEDPEDVVNGVYSKMLVLRTVAVLAGFAGLVLALAADDGLLVAAAVELALRAAWAVCALVCAFGLYEAFRLARAARMGLRSHREGKAARTAMTAGEQETEFIDMMTGVRAETLAWWEENPRGWVFWRGAVTRLAFLGCAALALDFWLPSWLAALAASGVTGAVIGLEVFTRSVLLKAADLVAFIDPRRPRNTPEV